MTVEEAVLEKRTLELGVLQLIKRFEKSTGLGMDGLDIRRVDCRTHTKAEGDVAWLTQVKARVEL